MNKKTINYSQCWEDPDILREALSIESNDFVLSISSGGDNTLALLLNRPYKLTSIDLNIAQNHLLELKLAAAKSLPYNEYLEFLGVKNSEHRLEIFKNVQHLLPRESALWWSSHESLVNIGVINCGRFEKFTAWSAKYVLPLIHSKKTILKFISIDNINEQVSFYQEKWNTRGWRLFLGLASNRLALKRFARQRGMFTYSEPKTVAKIYRERLERNINHILVKDNFFLHYNLTGRYNKILPPYLQERGFSQLKQDSTSNLSIETIDLLSYLKSQPDSSISKFNLSDIFEALSPDANDKVWEEIVRTAKNGAVIVYWNNLVRRSCPTYLSAHVQTNDKFASELKTKDKVFFYDSFHVNTIIK